jgi:hypothetical protein
MVRGRADSSSDEAAQWPRDEVVGACKETIGHDDANLFFRVEALLSDAENLFSRSRNLYCGTSILMSREEILSSCIGTLFPHEENPISRAEGFLFRNQILKCGEETLFCREANHEFRVQTLFGRDHGFDCGKSGFRCRKTGLERGTGTCGDGSMRHEAASRRQRRAIVRWKALPMLVAMKQRPVPDTGLSHRKCPKPGFRSTVFK